MITQIDSQRVRHSAPLGNTPTAPDSVGSAEIILRKCGARAISILTQPRTLSDGRTILPRLSANDCYVALEDACRKMARVAVRKYAASPVLQQMEFSDSVGVIFPDAPAYLTRCIRSVISDAERLTRREAPTISMDQPVSYAGKDGDSALCLKDTFASRSASEQPEAALEVQQDRLVFRNALETGLKSIPHNYLEALKRDMARERERMLGIKVAPESDRERQTICRARAALSLILKRECGPDNPFISLLSQQRNSRVRQKSAVSLNWTRERQDDLFRKLMNTQWADRTAMADISDSVPDGHVEEAIVNEVGTSRAKNAASPSPEMRKAMRVMDVYTLNDNPTSHLPEAQDLYTKASSAREQGKIEEAIRLYREAYEIDSGFLAAHNEVGVLLSQIGNLRDALKVYLSIIENPAAGAHRYIAATNAADIYLTWFDAGRNRERNIERATYYARLAMERPSPMRACNMLQALVKDKYYREAQQVMQAILIADAPECRSERFLKTLFQIRDADLVAWWNWLDGEIGKE